MKITAEHHPDLYKSIADARKNVILKGAALLHAVNQEIKKIETDIDEINEPLRSPAIIKNKEPIKKLISYRSSFDKFKQALEDYNNFKTDDIYFDSSDFDRRELNRALSHALNLTNKHTYIDVFLLSFVPLLLMSFILTLALMNVLILTAIPAYLMVGLILFTTLGVFQPDYIENDKPLIAGNDIDSIIESGLCRETGLANGSIPSNRNSIFASASSVESSSPSFSQPVYSF